MSPLSLLLTGAFAAFALVAFVLRKSSYTARGKANLACVAGVLASSAAFSLVLDANSWLVPLLLLTYGLIKVPPFKSFGLVVPLGLFVVTGARTLGDLPVSGQGLVLIWVLTTIVGLVGWFIAGLRSARW